MHSHPGSLAANTGALVVQLFPTQLARALPRDFDHVDQPNRWSARVALWGSTVLHRRSRAAAGHRHRRRRGKPRYAAFWCHRGKRSCPALPPYSTRSTRWQTPYDCLCLWRTRCAKSTPRLGHVADTDVRSARIWCAGTRQPGVDESRPPIRGRPV